MKAPSSLRFEGQDRRRHGLRNRFRRKFHGPGETRSPLPSADFSGWAADLYRSDATDSPLLGAVFTIEQLELHARALADAHMLGLRRVDDRLLGRLGDSERVIGRCHLLLSTAHAAGRRMAPAAEWLLDNRWVIEEAISLAREHVDGDDTLLALATAGIEELNTKYGNGAHGRFFLFHRLQKRGSHSPGSRLGEFGRRNARVVR